MSASTFLKSSLLTILLAMASAGKNSLLAQPPDVLADDAVVLTPGGLGAYLDGPWGESLLLEVSTSGTFSPDSGVDPAAPQRVAVSFQHPDTGEWVHLNFVEMAEVVIEVPTISGETREFVELIVNTETPFFAVGTPGLVPVTLNSTEPVSVDDILNVPVWYDVNRFEAVVYHVVVTAAGGNTQLPIVLTSSQTGEGHGDGDPPPEGPGSNHGEGGDPGGGDPTIPPVTNIDGGDPGGGDPTIPTLYSAPTWRDR